MLIAHGMDTMMTGMIHLGGARPLRSALSVTRAITALSKRYPPRATMSQNMMELGVGYKRTFMIRTGWPMSTTMNRPHMVTAEMARNSPRMVIFPNAFQSCR